VSQITSCAAYNVAMSTLCVYKRLTKIWHFHKLVHVYAYVLETVVMRKTQNERMSANLSVAGSCEACLSVAPLDTQQKRQTLQRQRLRSTRAKQV